MSAIGVDISAITPPAAPPRAGRSAARRLLRRPAALASGIWLAALIGVAIIAPIALPWVETQHAGDLLATNASPSLHHLLGTDALGRDVLERLLVGTRITILGVGEALIVILALGVPLGLAAGYLGGRVDAAVSWLSDLTFSVPAIVVIIVVLAVFPGSMLAGMTTFGVLAAPGLMRVVRSATLPLRDELYIKAARVSGLSRGYIVTRHVLPRIAGAVIVQASFLAALALAVESGLAFLSLLVAAPAPSWGGMVADGTSVIFQHPWLIWPPGVAIALTMIALCVLGDAVRDASTERWDRRSARPARRRVRARTRSQATPTAPADPDALLSVEDLTVAFASRADDRRVVEGVSFAVRPGETVGIVGESGCGKTVTTSAILGLLPAGGSIRAGRVMFAGRDLAHMTERELARIRGKAIALVAQEPMVGLDPAFKIGWQLEEAVRQHLDLTRRQARARVLELLESVQLSEPRAVAQSYAHELSGGMAQRVAIARALAGEPRLLIADEPTTALDVTVQREILDLLRDLTTARQMAILLVTHDWGVVADICDRIVVMYAGQVVERSDPVAMFDRPLHPYTQALLSANPHNAPDVDRLPTIPGEVPELGARPAGCRFEPRCSYATRECGEREIPLVELAERRQTRCLHFDRLAHR